MKRSQKEAAEKSKQEFTTLGNLFPPKSGESKSKKVDKNLFHCCHKEYFDGKPIWAINKPEKYGDFAKEKKVPSETL